MRVVKCEYQCQNWIAHGIHGLTIGWAYREHCTTLCVVISICSYCSRVGAAPVLGFTIIVVQRGLLSHSNYSILFSIFLRGTVGKIMKCKTVKHESYNSQTNFWHVNGSNFAQLDMLGFCPRHVNKSGMWRDYESGRVQVRLETASTLVFMVTGANSPITARSSAETVCAPLGQSE